MWYVAKSNDTMQVWADVLLSGTCLFEKIYVRAEIYLTLTGRIEATPLFTFLIGAEAESAQSSCVTDQIKCSIATIYQIYSISTVSNMDPAAALTSDESQITCSSTRTINRFYAGRYLSLSIIRLGNRGVGQGGTLGPRTFIHYKH